MKGNFDGYVQMKYVKFFEVITELQFLRSLKLSHRVDPFFFLIRRWRNILEMMATNGRKQKLEGLRNPMRSSRLKV